MDENENARSRLEAWVGAWGGAHNAKLSYARTSLTGERTLWTVTLVVEEPGPASKVVFEASAAELKNASAAVILGLAEYGINLPE